MSKRLLVDRFGDGVDLSLTESSDGKGWVVRGEFGKADVPTANGRIYPRHVWEREIDKISSAMNDGKVFMLSEHPSDGKTKLPLVSGLMKKLEIMPDGRVIGEAVILDNDHGRQLMSIYKAGGKVGVSSRGMGSTKMVNGVEHVDDDYSYMTHDYVADPAVRTSFPDLKSESAIKTVFGAADIVKDGDKYKVVCSNKAIPYKREVVFDNEKDAADYVIKNCTTTFDKIDGELQAVDKPEEKPQEESTQAELSVESSVKSEVAVEDIAVATVEDDTKIFDDKIGEAMELAKKDQEIADLKKVIESKDQEIADLIAGAKEITESAKRIGLALCYERVIAGDDRAALVEEVGPVSGFATESSLMEAVKKAKKKIIEKKMSKMREKKKMEAIEAKHKAEVARLQEAAAKATKEAAAKEKALAESLKEQKAMAAKLYLESVLRGNPNAQKIRNLCEGVEDKKKIDSLVKEFSIDESAQNEYNYLRNKLDRLETMKKQSSLVESQLEKELPKAVVTGVDAEIQGVIG